MVETLITMALVGVILGIVGRGYQTLSRLNLATYQMSQRMELTAFLQRFSYEVSSALSVETGEGFISFQRIDPTLNLEHIEPAPARLPWPIPPNATSTGLLNPSFQVTVRYDLLPEEKQVRRTAFETEETVAVNVGEFTPALESGGRILSVVMRPAEMTAPVKSRILMPVLTP